MTRSFAIRFGYLRIFVELRSYWNEWTGMVSVARAASERGTSQAPKLSRQTMFEGRVYGMAWPLVVVAGIDRLSVVSADTGRVRFRIGGISPIPLVAFSPNGQLLAVQLDGRTEIGIWEVASGRH